MNLKDMKINSVKNIINRKWLILSLYVGLVSFNVPSILCYADSSSVLTYEKIYNNTNYPQVKYKTRTFQQQIRESDKNKKESLEEENNLEFNFESDDETNNALLVAYSHDPYRNSMLESDYVKGIGLSKPQYYSKGDRDKRGVAHLYNMIYCATGCDPISYKGYGCYCGFLGAGRPMDGIDKCCQMHDRCYETLFCPFFTVYFQPYYWKCYRGQPLCALENYETRNQYINGCASKLCECDRRFAMCLQKYRCPRRRALCTSQPLRLLQNLLMFP